MIEPIFGPLKQVLGFRQFSMRLCRKVGRNWLCRVDSSLS